MSSYAYALDDVHLQRLQEAFIAQAIRMGLYDGSIVNLDKKAEEPVDLRVNGKLVARGEVVLVDDTYGLRVTQIVDRPDPISPRGLSRFYRFY